jgi:tetraacyldisaccharide 4'-kinase
LRHLLAPLGFGYGAVMGWRNFLYDRGLLRSERVEAPVVSVGNLGVGGTGKTPLVAWLVERARARGKHPGVLARGYGKAPGERLNDEGTLLARRFPDLAQVQHPDRVAGAKTLLSARRADYLILDDGFQHRRIARDLDLVCIDAAKSLRSDHVLPWGTLREPLAGFPRVDAVVLTRCGPVDLATRRTRVEELAGLAGRQLPVFLSDHVPDVLVAQPAGVPLPVSELRGRKVVLLCAIARPGSFEQTVTGLGAEVVGRHSYRDHHRYTERELAAAAQQAGQAGALLVTTEKDDAKLSRWEHERHVLRIELRFLEREPPDELLLLR